MPYREASDIGALEGVTVIDMSRLLPGPYCSMTLADHGARVIAVEDRRFADDGIFLETVYRNKQHMTLNLKTDEGREIFFRLIKSCDVFMEGFRPGVVQRLGIGYETIKKRNPGIVYCAITGYGQTGAYRNRVGHDVNFLAMSGVLDLIGTPNRPPAIPGIQIADLAAGGMNAAIGILLALLQREKSGRGQYIDISMTDGLVSLLSAALSVSRASGRSLCRGDWLLSHRYACYNTYETSDDRHIAIGALEPRFWENLCRHLKVSQYAPLQYDETRREEIKAFMQTAFKKKTLAQWQQELGDLEVCWAPVKTMEDVLTDPFFKMRGAVVQLEACTGGKAAVPGVPIKLDRTPGSARTAPARFGEHTTPILRELGYSQSDIEDFYQKEVV